MKFEAYLEKAVILIKTQVKPSIWAHLFFIPLISAQLTFHNPWGEAADSQESQEEKSHGWGLAGLCKKNVEQTPQEPLLLPSMVSTLPGLRGAFGVGVESRKVFAMMMIFSVSLSLFFFLNLNTSSFALFTPTWDLVAFSSPCVVNVSLKLNVSMRWSVVVFFFFYTVVKLRSDLPSWSQSVSWLSVITGQRKWGGVVTVVHPTCCLGLKASTTTNQPPVALPDSTGKQRACCCSGFSFFISFFLSFAQVAPISSTGGGATAYLYACLLVGGNRHTLVWLSLLLFYNLILERKKRLLSPAPASVPFTVTYQPCSRGSDSLLWSPWAPDYRCR